MGGKEKQRTKGNLKPSSSGSAAALISKDGTVGFVGFGGLPGSGTSSLGYVPMAASVADDADSSVDAEFRMVMRKLMKRDAVTKLKAMQEFTHLCKSATLDAVESALPFWPRLFNKLALDVDYKVREATQQAMEQLVLRVGRNLAPHLRYVIGPWLCAQFDTYPVVASSARKAFQAAFSEEKQSEAIVYCRKELIEFLQDNILKQTPSTLSDPKFVAEDEREARYIRVFSSSILALGNLISVTSNQTSTDMEEHYLNILKQNKFWKSAKHKSPHVRGAVFCTVCIACEHLPALMSSLSSLVSPAVLCSLDDSEPAVCQHLWNAVLSLLKNITDCWKHVSVRKAVLPKLWSVLKNGGSGSATAIFPNLLPFLSKLPSEVVDCGTGFYQEFFSNIQDGVAKESVQNSPSECSAVITAYMECLRFCLVNGPDGKEPDFLVQEYLVKHQLLPVLKTSLTGKSKLKHSNLYSLVADLLCYLSKWSEIEVKEQRMQQQCACVLKSFWEGFTAVCMKVIMGSDDKGNHIQEVNAVSHCLISLMCPSRKRKQLHKVAFAAMPSTPSNHDPSVNRLDTEREEGNSFVFIQHPAPSSINLETLYNGYLLDLVCRICIFCLEEIEQRNSLIHLKLVASLVPNFLSVKLLTTLLKISNEHCKENYPLCENSYSLLMEQFVKDVVFPWMKACYGKDDECELGGTNVMFESRSVEYVIDMFCCIIKTLSEDKQLELISQSFQQDESVHFMYTMLEKGLHLEVTGVTAWFHSFEANERLLDLSQALVLHRQHRTVNVTPLKEVDQEIVWKLLKICIVTKRAVIKPKREFLDKIFQHFLRILRQTEQHSEQELLLLLEILQSFLEACEDHPHDIVPCTSDLLLSVFQLQWNEACLQSSVVPDTLSTTWKTGLKLLSHLPDEVQSSPSLALLLNASEALQEKLMKIETLDRVDELASMAMTLVKDANLFSMSVETEEVSLSQKVFLSFIPSQEELALHRRDYSKAAWLFTLLQHNKQPVITDVCDSLDERSVTGCSLTKHQKVVLFIALLVKQMITECSIARALKSETLRRNSCVYLWLEISWLRQWCSCVLGCEDNLEDLPECFKETDSTVGELVLMLKESGGHLLEHVKQNSWCESLLTEAFTRSRTQGLLWSVVLGRLLDEFHKSGVSFELAVMLADVQSLAPIEETKCQTLIALMSRLESIYELKVITERYSTLLHEDNDESAFACVLAILGHSLQQWFQQIKHDEEAALLEYQLTMTGVLDELLQWKQTHSSFLLMNSSLDNASMSVFTLNSALIGIMKMALQHCSNVMNSKHWDFILCSLAGWLQMCEENKFLLVKSLKCATLCCQVCSLFCTTAQFFEDNASKLSKGTEDATCGEDLNKPGNNASYSVLSCEIGGYPPNLLSEWQEFFSGTLFNVVFNLFLFHAEHSRKTYVKPSLWTNRVSESLGCAVVHTPTYLIKEHNFEASAHESTRGTSNLPQWIEDLMQHCLPLLMSDLHGVQCAAFHMLSKVMTEITFIDNEETEAEKEEEELIRSPPVPLMKLIDSTSLRMTEMMSEAGVPFGEFLDTSSDSEAQNVSLALMLAWKLLVKFFRSMPQETRVVYAKYIKQHKLVHSLLVVLFRLIPLKKIGVVITEESQPIIGRFCGQRTVQEMACSVYYSLSQWMPAIVRQWWNGLDKHRSSIVDRFTTSCITPQLCQREMHLVQNSSIRFHNMQVKTRPGAREVAAVYTVDEISMELVVKLAANHPLGVVSVESGKKIGVATAQWRSWMLQMTTFLTHQNGSIMDGLILWKRNVDKRFEGVDDCMICFSVIHGSNYSLPKLSCKTCKKKFHSACLYKWFSTSNNATCPLCRNLF